MAIRLADIDQNNWYKCINLKLRDEQKDMVASNSFSLVQAAYEHHHRPRAVYLGDEMVGFAMYGTAPEPRDPEQRYWIYRLMIDQAHQGKGYGRSAIELVLSEMRQLPECQEAWISFHPENVAAEKLYLSLGFRHTGQIIAEEVALKLKF